VDPDRWLLLWLVAGVVCFAAVGLGMMAAGAPLLALPGVWAIYVLETALMLSVAITLVLLGLSCLYALARSRVEAHQTGLVVVNGYRRREYEWAEVVAVHLPPGAPWATPSSPSVGMARRSSGSKWTTRRSWHPPSGPTCSLGRA
jgi:hypothetical protein